MKKIIRYLAKVSGVEKDIRFEERHFIAIQLKDTSYWFSNHERYGKLYPFISYLSSRLSYNFRIQGDSAREQFDELANWDCKGPDGSWANFKFLHNIGKLKL